MTRKRVKNQSAQDTWREPRKRTPHDYETAACILDVAPPGEAVRQGARRTVACNSRDGKEAKEFMLMLGIYPEPDEVR